MCWIIKQLSCPILRNISWFYPTRPTASSTKYQAIFRAISQVNCQLAIYLTDRIHFAMLLYSDNTAMKSKRGDSKEVTSSVGYRTDQTHGKMESI